MKLLTPTPTVWKELIIQLQQRKGRIHFPPGSTSSIESTIKELVDVFVKHAPFQKNQPAPFVELVELCCEFGCVDATSKLFARLFSGDGNTVSVQYINSLMVPLIPAIKDMLVRHRIPYTSKPFDGALRFIMLAFANKILGEKPPEPTSLITSAKRNTCTCHECSQVRTFLIGASELRTLHLQRIGAPKRRHVEKQIDTFIGPSVATYTMIGTTPQGLSVSSNREISYFVVNKLILSRFPKLRL
jgi:hypothetical protein